MRDQSFVVPDSQDVVEAGNSIDLVVSALKQSGVPDSAIALALATIASRECSRAFGSSAAAAVLTKTSSLASNLAVSRVIN